AAKHFIVHSGGLVTEVLGTSFEIVKDAQTNKVQVSVVTGKVAVYDTLLAVKTSPGNKLLKGIVITPNQKIIYNPSNNKYITSLVDEPQPLAENLDSLQAKFVFDETYLSEVVQPIEELYGINIEFEKQSLGNCHFTGDISNFDLYKKLDIICQSIRTSYEVRGTTILIKEGNCN
ncbi:MAG TPA: FecR domain-containing protein, partial [Chitinophagaceae bacterium]|nr:FecR domain-containing protein [Chitinophagaceae bacterium]